MSLAMRCIALLAVAAAYTPPRRSPRSPGGRQGPAGAPRPKRTPVVEPLEQWGNFDVGPHRMGVSTVSWGDATCGWRPDMIRKKKSSLELFGTADVNAVYQTLTAGGIKTWDVSAGAEGAELLGRAAEANMNLDPPRLAVRCAPSLRTRLKAIFSSKQVARHGASSVARGVRNTLDIMGSAYVDLLLVGPAEPTSSVSAVKKAASAVAAQAGRVDGVGIANVRGGKALRAADAALRGAGLRPVACAVDLSLVDNGAIRDGTLAAAKDLGLTVLARSPLYAGLSSGEITAQNPTGGARFGVTPKFRFRALNELAPLHGAIEQVASMVEARRADDERSAAASAGREPPKTRPEKVLPTQVALQWIAAKGCVPMPAVKTEAHAKVILGCQGWALTEAEVKVLDAVLPRSPPKFPRLR